MYVVSMLQEHHLPNTFFQHASTLHRFAVGLALQLDDKSLGIKWPFFKPRDQVYGPADAT
jgi:hypothetical protein